MKTDKKEHHFIVTDKGLKMPNNGLISGIDVSKWNVGEKIYLDPGTIGGLTNKKPK